MKNFDTDAYDYSLHALIKFLWEKRFILLVVPTLAGVLAIIWTLTTADTYMSDATLSPTEEAKGGGLGNVAGQLGGLASLAGISLGGESTEQVTVALEILKSRQFVANFVNQRNIKPEIMAVSEWDRESNSLVYDADIWDPNSKQWLREPANGRPAEPTDQEVYEVFREMINIERDSVTGLVKVSLEYYSPVLAQAWLAGMVEQINQDMRERAISTASENIAYLEQKVAEIADIEMKTVFYQLIQEQSKNLMLAEVRSEFVFTVIDPAVAPELKHAPKRALIVLFVGFIVGFITLGVLTIWFLIVPRS